MNTLRIAYFFRPLYLAFSISVVFFISCTEAPLKTGSDRNVQTLEDSVIILNKHIVQSENQEIDDFIHRYQWEMIQTQTGLRYMIYKAGNGPNAKSGDIVSIKYKVNLLTGDLVYMSDSGAMLTFEVGKRNVVSGLEEGIMFMKKGSRAKLIVPSHLAFGLLGDMEKIPARAALVCDVELCAINPVKK